ncbi:hypothetical protein [Bacillus massiliigorillae]|uniref:hypothetical protein n=1 Tax=Bacillus massiliigorillae TaxID=1243664 RepID=UPI0003A1DF55|nr:hypothetical protein [Bacillus massiliigorillae]
MIRTILASLICLLLVGCNVNKEKEYLQLIEDNKYENLLKATEEKSGDLQSNYYSIASILIDKQKVDDVIKNEKYISSRTNKLSKLDADIIDNYKSIDSIPDDLKEKLKGIYNDSLSRKQEKDEEEIKQSELRRQADTQTESFRRKRDMNERVSNPQPVRLGMTKDEVLRYGWGRPNDINRTITEYGIDEQWVYSNYKYLYFENGVLTSIQD